MDALQTGIRARIVPLASVAELVPNGGVVLDLGCGQGLVAELVSPRVDRVVGIDFDPRKCAMARQRLAAVPNVEIRHADVVAELERMPEGRAATVLLSDALSSFPSEVAQDRVLSLAARALAPGGTLVLKFIDTDPAWKVRLSWALSFVVCRALRLSRSDGQRFLYRSRSAYRRVLEALDLEVSERLLHRERRLVVPHAVLVARKRRD